MMLLLRTSTVIYLSNLRRTEYTKLSAQPPSAITALNVFGTESVNYPATRHVTLTRSPTSAATSEAHKVT